MEILSKAKAKKRLDAIAFDCENENYHTLAGIIWDSVIPKINDVTERTVFVIPLEYGGVEEFIVVP